MSAPNPTSLCHFALALLAFAGPVLRAAEPMPAWVLPGILAVETRSHYRPDGSIDYVDRRVGAAGERGPFQMTRDAFDLVAKPGERFEELANDHDFAEALARRYLQLLWRTFSDRDWFVAAGRWNAGPHGRWSRLFAYAKRAQQAGTP